jgi:hypothetical protein
MNPSQPQPEATLDLARVERLIGELEAEVAHASPDAPGVTDLREEIATLKSLIASPRPRAHWVTEGLHALRGAATAARGEIARDGFYLTEIGRLLGL